MIGREHSHVVFWDHASFSPKVKYKKHYLFKNHNYHLKQYEFSNAELDNSDRMLKKKNYNKTKERTS